MDNSNPEREKDPDIQIGDGLKSAEQVKRRPKVVVRPGIAVRGLDGGEKKAISEKEGHDTAQEIPMEAKEDAMAQPDLMTTSEETGTMQETVINPEPGKNPGQRLRDVEMAARKAPRLRIPWQYRLRPTSERAHRAFWDVTGIISLILNAILISIVISMGLQIQSLKSNFNTVMNSIVGGLYSNFGKMDQASINTTVAVDTQIPLNFQLPVTQNTAVVLTGNVVIPKAHVVINTGGLNIDSQASVTLPAGTNLPIALSMEIPVQTTIPISLKVPIKIPLNQTDLHDPFTGLQTTLRPLYCEFNKNAQYPEGTYLCAEQGSTPSGTP